MADSLHEKLGRRSFLASGVAVVGTVAATTGAAHALAPSVAEAMPIGADARYGAEDPDVPAESLLGLSAGMMVGPFEIERVAMREGAARVEAKGRGVQFRVDILRRSHSPRALAVTDDFSLYLCNNGNGDDPTDENRGVGVMTLARYLQTTNPEVPEGLMTYGQRRKEFGARDRNKF